VGDASNMDVVWSNMLNLVHCDLFEVLKIGALSRITLVLFASCMELSTERNEREIHGRSCALLIKRGKGRQ